MTSNAQGEAARKSALPEISIYGKIRKLKGTGAAVPIGSGILYMTEIIFLPALEDFLKRIETDKPREGCGVFGAELSLLK